MSLDKKLDYDNKPVNSALGAGIITFTLLALPLLLLVIFFDFSHTNLGAMAFLLALICVTLVAKMVYDGEKADIFINSAVTKQVSCETEPIQILFSEVYENSPVAYLVTGTRGEIHSVNPATSRIFDLPAQKIVGQNFFSLINNSSNPHFDLMVEKIQKEISVSLEEIQLIQGSKISWLLLSVFHYKNSLGKPQCLMTILDITKQKEVEVAKSEFVSLASHQLRTPITGMRWSAELLLMDGGDSLTEQQRRYVTRLLENIEQMNSLVDDFLQVSRFDLGTRTTNTQLINIEEICEEVVKEQTVSANAKGLTIEKNYSNDCHGFYTDPALVKMVITNLFSNAIKYSKSQGEVYLTVELIDGNVNIIIKDTGIGIPNNDQTRIFSKLYRTTNAQSEVPDGTGLGLYIAHKATLVLGGRLTF